MLLDARVNTQVNAALQWFMDNQKRVEKHYLDEARRASALFPQDTKADIDKVLQGLRAAVDDLWPIAGLE